VQVPPCLSSGDVIIDCQWEVQTFRRLNSVLGPITGVELPKNIFATARLAGLISEIGGDWVQAGIWSLSRFV
jgi:hypothetical protein